MAAGRWVGRGDKNGGDGAAVDAMRQLISHRLHARCGRHRGGREGRGPDALQRRGGRQRRGPVLRRRRRPDRRHHADGQGHAERAGRARRRRARTRCSTRPRCSTWRSSPSARRPRTRSTSPSRSRRTSAGSPRPRASSVADVTVCVLDRPRHDEMVTEIRRTGARIHFISDGDVAGAISAARPDSGVDLLYGIGGTPEGIITAAALKCMGGAMQGRLWPQGRRGAGQGDGRRARPGPRADHGRPGPRRQRVLLRHRHHRRRAAARRALPAPGLHHPVDRDALQVRHRPA